MALAKIADLYPNYKEDIFGGNDIKNFSVYDYTNDKIGSVYDIIVDETGKFRYLVIDTGFWVFGKKVLLPAAKASIDYSQERIYAKELTKQQVEDLPEYDDDMTMDYDYEERVRKVYRGVEYDQNDTDYVVNTNAAAGAAQVYDNNATYDTAAQGNNVYNSETYSYDREPAFYQHNEDETDGRQSLKLYEERLIANKERFLAGTVSVGKRVETETATVAVPVEKERVVIERSTPTSNNVVSPGEATFQDQEVARIDIYEESADIEKQAFVREEVSVHKEVEKDTVTANETIRREELEIENNGDTVIDRDASV